MVRKRLLSAIGQSDLPYQSRFWYNTPVPLTGGEAKTGNNKKEKENDMNKTVGCVVAAAAALVAVGASAFEYNVTQPALRPRWSGAAAGEWTLDREAAFEKAKAEGAYTIVLFTGSWWCPYCETFEERVLTSQAWKDYVTSRGYYLAECDYPYRFPVPEGQEGKSLHPELGNGWGFKCWLYDADYLAENGLTAEDAFTAIQKMYDYQDSMALPGSVVDTINRYGGGTMELHKIPYVTLVVFLPDGTEAGRMTFQKWLQPSAVSEQDAVNYVIGCLEAIRVGGTSNLFANPGAGGLAGTAAQTYDAVLTDAAGVPVGVALFKTAKKVGEKPIAITASVQVNGSPKAALKGTSSGAEGEIISLEKKGSACIAKVIIGEDGVVGSYTDGKASYNVQGARNIFKAKDAAAKARAATLVKGSWPIAFKTADNGGSAFANGYSTFSATVGNGGKVKVTGTLGDGSKVNVSAQAIVGEGGKAIVPVADKKGAYSFLLEFVGGQLTKVSGVSLWKSTNRQAQFTASWDAAAEFSPAAGTGSVTDIMYLQIGGFDPAVGIGGKAVTISPADDAILKSGNRWTGTKGVSDLAVTFRPQDGTFKGSFNFYVNEGGAKPRKIKATVSGVVIGGVPYGTAVIRGVGSFPIKLAGSCGGGC